MLQRAGTVRLPFRALGRPTSRAGHPTLLSCVCVRAFAPMQGAVAPLSAEQKQDLLDNHVTAMAKVGLRCIALTYTDLPLEDANRCAFRKPYPQALALSAALARACCCYGAPAHSCRFSTSCASRCLKRAARAVPAQARRLF